MVFRMIQIICAAGHSGYVKPNSFKSRKDCQMNRLLKTLTAGATVTIGIAVSSAVYAQQSQTPSPQTPSMMPGMQQGDMMKMMPQMSQMMDGCMQMMKSHMSQPTGPSPKPDVEK